MASDIPQRLPFNEIKIDIVTLVSLLLQLKPKSTQLSLTDGERKLRLVHPNEIQVGGRGQVGAVVIILHMGYSSGAKDMGWGDNSSNFYVRMTVTRNYVIFAPIAWAGYSWQKIRV